jgi:phosphopantothenoylcysteine decarboxylase/phosphopantothenate--cysteine ligase
MGYAIAKEASQRGAETYLVSGPTQLEAPPGVKVVRVRSAAQMKDAVLELYPEIDIVVKSAAVADYRPRESSVHKLKKKPGPITLQLDRTEDILAILGKEKKRQVLIGFAAETENILDRAKEKLQGKNLDLVVANDVSQGVFGADSATVHLLSRNEESITLNDQSKPAIASKLLDLAYEIYLSRKT